MSGQSKFSRSIVVMVAAVMMSTLTVGAAVVPAQATVTPVTDAIQMNLNA